jgi:hypothetical protein
VIGPTVLEPLMAMGSPTGWAHGPVFVMPQSTQPIPAKTRLTDAMRNPGRPIKSSLHIHPDVPMERGS